MINDCIDINFQRIKIKMQANNHKKQKEFDEFLIRILNSKMMTIEIAPLLTIDTTAVAALRQITIQNDEYQIEGNQGLNQSASKLLTVIEKVSKQYQMYSRKQSISKLLHDQELFNIKKKNLQLDNWRVEQSKIKNHIQVAVNNENFNVSNFQHLKNNIKQESSNLTQREFRQIIRPEYRKQIQPNTHRIKRNKQYQQLEIDQHKNNHNQNHISTVNKSYLTSSDVEQIPIMKKRLKIKNVKMIENTLRERSKSPKVEGKLRKNQLKDISSISRNYQTQTDVSFQIDLNSLGILSENRDSSVKIQKSNFSQKIEKKQIHNISKFKEQETYSSRVISSNFQKKEEGQSQKIQQEEPWECEQQQIEQQLRQIDERLSQRAYKTQRFLTEADFFQKYYQTNSSQSSHFHNEIKPSHNNFNETQPLEIDLRKKQTKTVRLSLTPIKNKPSLIKIKKEVQIIKTPIRDKKNQKNQANCKPYKVNCLIQSEEYKKSPGQIQCQKWKKPQRGLITVQIQKFIKNT